MWHACVPEWTTYHQLRWKNSQIIMQFIWAVLISYIKVIAVYTDSIFSPTFFILCYLPDMRNESKLMHQGEITRNRINASFKNTRNISKAKASQIIGFLGQYLSSFRTMILQQSMELRLHWMKPYSFLSSKFPLISFFFFSMESFF